jgi:exosome complex component CSL4
MEDTRKTAVHYTAAPPSLPPIVKPAISAAAVPQSTVSAVDVKAAIAKSALVPGEIVCPAAGVVVGDGCYVSNESIRASVVGKACFVSFAAQGPEGMVGTVTVAPLKSIQNKKSIVVPHVGSIVHGKVTRVTSTMVHVRLLVVGDVPVGSASEAPAAAASDSGFTGVIKQENCRDSDVDKAVLSELFRPGDMVRAVVISLGTRRSYFLATAAVDTGVVLAHSEAGHVMRPLAHDKMVCSVTGIREGRKVARVGF